jgi:hypothetical protein
MLVMFVTLSRFFLVSALSLVTLNFSSFVGAHFLFFPLVAGRLLYGDKDINKRGGGIGSHPTSCGDIQILWGDPEYDRQKPMCRAHCWLRRPQYKREIMLFLKNIVGFFKFRLKQGVINTVGCRRPQFKTEITLFFF